MRGLRTVGSRCRNFLNTLKNHLRFTALCSGGQTTACAQVSGNGGKELKTPNFGQLKEPKEFRLDNIQVTTGKIEISFISNAKAGQWLNVTEVVLEKATESK